MTNTFKDEKSIQEYTFSKIKENFEHHYHNCESYRRYCETEYNFTPANINSIEDLYKIPQIPTSIFKSIDVCSVDKNSCRCCKSSGTKGFVSKIYRDEYTIQAFLDGIIREAKDLYDFSPDNSVVLNLGPSEEESGDVWIAYAMAFLKNAFETYNYMHSGVLEINQFIKKLQNYNFEKKVVILGAPALLVKVFNYMESSGIKLKLPGETILLTAGGWKNKDGNTMVREEMSKLVMKYLSISDSRNFDVYNQVESNTAFFECKYHNKHIPEGVLVIIRDPRTLEKLEDGKQGVITFLDSSSNSYPAYVITDDIGYVTNGCDCGYKGQIFHYIRRVKTVETKGCAMKLDQNSL